jgi:hypothetical protein
MLPHWLRQFLCAHSQYFIVRSEIRNGQLISLRVNQQHWECLDCGKNLGKLSYYIHQRGINNSAAARPRR